MENKHIFMCDKEDLHSVFNDIIERVLESRSQKDVLAALDKYKEEYDHVVFEYSVELRAFEKRRDQAIKVLELNEKLSPRELVREKEKLVHSKSESLLFLQAKKEVLEETYNGILDRYNVQLPYLGPE
jgi:hypothetical protein